MQRERDSDREIETYNNSDSTLGDVSKVNKHNKPSGSKSSDECVCSRSGYTSIIKTKHHVTLKGEKYKQKRVLVSFMW